MNIIIFLVMARIYQLILHFTTYHSNIFDACLYIYPIVVYDLIFFIIIFNLKICNHIITHDISPL